MANVVISMWKPTPPKYRAFRKQVFTKLAAVSPFVYHIGDSSLLREASRIVSRKDIQSEEFQKKVAYLKRCLKKYRKLTDMGVGIAAVQVGIPERFAIIYLPKYSGDMMTIINPQITKQSEEKLLYPEICMSSSPAIAPVIRPAWIEFSYYNEYGEKQLWSERADDERGMRFNRVFQHEIDHMDGIINIDRVQSREIIFESDPRFYKRATFITV